MVGLRGVLQSVASGYSVVDGGFGQEALQSAQSAINAAAVPAGWVVKSSRRIGKFTDTPWLGFFDPDETVDPKEGLYVCWIFEPDLEHVVVSIQQGTESLTKLTLEDVSIPSRLASDADFLRSALDANLISGLTESISFGSGARQRRYAAGSVAHRRFSVQELPSETALIKVQREFCKLLGETIAVRNTTLLRSPGALNQAVPGAGKPSPGGLEHFKPKSSNDYLVHLAATNAQRSRRHEKILNSYATWASSHGWTVASPHPVDLRLRQGPLVNEGVQAWTDAVMIEVKVVRQGNVTAAVREAIGQLATYPFVVVPEEARPSIRTAALFSEDVGELWVKVLENALGISTLWWEEGAWVGGNLAASLSLVD